MTVQSPLCIRGHSHGSARLLPVQAVDRGRREDQGGQNLSVALGLTLNKKEKSADKARLPCTPSTTRSCGCWLSRASH